LLFGGTKLGKFCLDAIDERKKNDKKLGFEGMGLLIQLKITTLADKGYKQTH
jgi:hypothetical protein